MTQRDLMRLRWRSHAPDEGRVVREYAAREEAGEIARDSNRFAIPPMEYARRLLDDGLREEWLNGAGRAPTARTARGAVPRNPPTAIPPAEGRSRLQWASEAMRAIGVEPESSEYLERLRAWREAWPPSRVRVLIVAESHVAEQPGERRSLGALAPIRLDWKLRVLTTLQRARVWLENACIIARYSPGGGRRASGTAGDQLLRTSFAAFVWPPVGANGPAQVWVIGRSVARALQGLPGIPSERVISQPQDRDQKRFCADMARLRPTLLQKFAAHD